MSMNNEILAKEENKIFTGKSQKYLARKIKH